jgi:hypothetical protein
VTDVRDFSQCFPVKYGIAPQIRPRMPVPSKYLLVFRGADSGVQGVVHAPPWDFDVIYFVYVIY